MIDLTQILGESIAAMHAINTGRPLHCINCDITFLDARVGMAHLRQHSIDRHPANPIPNTNNKEK